LQEIINLAHQQKARVFLYTYPWPAQVAYQENEKFSWDNWVREKCFKHSCDGYLEVYQKMLEANNELSDWYKVYYLQGDVHYSEIGNQLVAQTLANSKYP